MFKFISFGSGSSGNCYFLFTPTDGIVIDIGIGMRALQKYMRDYGLSINKIHHILITHDHTDHVKSVGGFVDKFKVPVYATKAVHQGINNNYRVGKKIPSDYVHFVEAGSTYEIGEFQVTPFSVPHDSNDNVGYCIRCEGVTFCLMTDIGHLTDDILHYISVANYLVIEANHDPEMLRAGHYSERLKYRITGPNGHLSNEEAGKAVAENMTGKLHHVWFCHLSDENNHPELARSTVESILKSHGILPGKDVLVDFLKRKSPSNVFELKVF